MRTYINTFIQAFVYIYTHASIHPCIQRTYIHIFFFCIVGALHFFLVTEHQAMRFRLNPPPFQGPISETQAVRRKSLSSSYAFLPAFAFIHFPSTRPTKALCPANSHLSFINLVQRRRRESKTPFRSGAGSDQASLVPRVSQAILTWF